MAQARKLQVPMPDRFCNVPGQEPPLKWNQWFQQLTDFFELSDAGVPAGFQLKDHKKNRYLRSLLGAEGLRQFTAHPVSSEIIITAFIHYAAAAKSIFGRPIHAIRAHYDFNMRRQGPHETVQEYVIALRTLMADCTFHGHEKHHLTVQLATGMYNKNTQQRLLAQRETDLDEFIRIAEAEESSAQDSSRFRNEIQPIVSAARYSNKPKFRPTGSGPGSFRPQNRGKTKTLVCYFGCGKPGHSYKDPTCPALNKKCRNCNGLNHFDKMCQKPKQSSAKCVRKYQDSCIKGAEFSTSICTGFKCSMTLKGPKNTCATVHAEVDTCSDITGIVTSDYYKYFGTIPLDKVHTSIWNFDQTEIKGILGSFLATVSFSSRDAQLRVYVLPDEYGNIFGKDAICALGLILDGSDGSVKMVKNVTPSMDTKHCELLAKFPNLTKDDLGCFPDYELEIVLKPDATPSIRKSRPIPLYRREKAISEILAMEKAGIWSRVERSDWVHPLVTVDKPNGEVRITTNLISLNKYVIPFCYPLPLIKDMFLQLKQSRVMSKIDFKKAFFHIKLQEKSRLLTTTETRIGLFAYNRLPMGLTDSAAVFQYAVHLAFSQIPKSIVFLDDDLVHDPTVKGHDATLEKVFQQANDKDFGLNLSKCEFGVQAVTFLGHIVSDGTLRPDPKNLEPIKRFPTPKTVKDVQRFLGMINYYSDFVDNLATIAEPLRLLTRKEVPFNWSMDCQNSFMTLKAKACENLKLFIFDPECETILTTDASDVAIGGVLSQLQHGREVPIAFGHLMLDSSQRNYAAYERKAFAVLYFCEYWNKCLLGRSFVLRTDHKSLSSLLTKGHNRRQSLKFQRWLERLEPYSFTVQYLVGSQNVVADALSRFGLDDRDPPMRAISALGLSMTAVHDATLADDVLKEVCAYIQTSKWPSKSTMQSAVKGFHTIRRELTISDGCLLRSGYQIVIPFSLRKSLLTEAHRGHPGMVRMKRKMRDTYWWPSMDSDIELHVRYCLPCQDSAKSVPKYRIPTGYIPTPQAPWSKVAMDITGPFHVAPTNKRVIVVLIHYYSKFPEVLCTGDITSKKIVKWLEDVFSRYGNPSKLVTDNGTQFTSYEFKEFLQSRGIIHQPTPYYNPERNGLVEVFNRYLKHGIQTFTAGNIYWDDGIRDLLTNFRATSPSSDSKSPAELFMNRPMRLALEVNREAGLQIQPITPNGDTLQDENQLAANTPTTTHLTFRGPFKVGDKVRSRLPHVPKGSSPFSAPKKVTEVLGNWTYKLEDGSVWNARKLRRFYEQAPTSHVEVSTEVIPRSSSRRNVNVPPLRLGIHHES